MRRPQLQLRIAGRTQPDQKPVAARDDVEGGHHLGVTAIQPLGQPQHRRQRADGTPQATLQRAVSVVRLLRRCLPMISRQ